MKKQLLFSFILINLFLFTSAQSFYGSIGGATNDMAQGIAKDNVGNVYITGYFALTVDFDLGPGAFNLTANGVNQDIFVAKYSTTGALLWAKNFGSSSNDGGYGIITDNNGAVYITGTFAGSVDFDPGPGVASLTSNGFTDIFVLKLDGNSNFGWAKSFGGTASENAGGIALDAQGNVFTTGNFNDAVDFDPGAGNYTINAINNEYNLFVSKLDADGNFLWAKTIGGANGSNMAFGIAVDPSGNVVTTGYYTGLMDFDPGAGVVALNTQNSGQGAYLLKLDADGNYIWAKSFDGPGGEAGQAVALDYLGNIYVTGSYQLTVDFDPGAGIYNLTSNGGTQDVFVIKLEASGILAWAKSMGGASADIGFGIAVAATGNVYVAGEFGATADFNPDAGVFELKAIGTEVDIFVMQLSTSGSLITAQGRGGTQNDWGTGIVVDNNGNADVTGVFAGVADFDPGTGTANLASVGGDDIFLLRHNFTNTVLPVKLGAFTASTSAAGNLLRWQTANEERLKAFVIERSRNNQEFIAIGKREASGSGHGSYHYFDDFLDDRFTYYRLKLEFENEASSYSAVLKTEGRKFGTAVSMFPNPVRSSFVIITHGNGMLNQKAQIVSVWGQSVQEFILSKNGQKVNTDALATGIYFIKFESGQFLRFLKQ